MDHPFPLIPQELIRALEQLYPDRCPTMEMTDREVWFNAGRAAVVKKLRLEHERQLSPE